jgi:hypothetical protein
MWNIFEHWWTALLIAAIVQLALAIMHVLKPATRKLWHISIPISIIIIGIGIERLVQTDSEKIDDLVKTCLKATADEDVNAIDSILSPDYSDSCHNSKKAALEFCRRWLGKPLIAKNRLPFPPEVSLSAPEAQVNMMVMTHIDPKSSYYGSVKVLLSKVKLYLQKNADKHWQVKRAELLEINNQPVNWSDIQN